MNKRGLFILFAFIFILLLVGCGCNKVATTPVTVSYGEPPELTGLPGAFTQEITPTNTDHAEVVLIPGGTYYLGSPTTDKTAIPDEQPAHKVDLYPFWLYTHEVTNAMYAECVAAGACIAPQQTEGKITDYYDVPDYAENPVVGVDWLMAYDYCQWAGGRLPTEAEWEAAARGKETLLYPWGNNNPDCTLANMKGCSVEQTTQPAAEYPDGASPFEALDMAGNAWEWVGDWYGQDYYDSVPRLNPQGPNLTDVKVVKGGGFKSNAFNLRTPGRLAVEPYDNYEDLGFRCVAGGPTGVSGVEHPADTHRSSDGGGSVEEGGGARRRISEISLLNSFCNTPTTSTYVFSVHNNFEGTYSMDFDGTAFACTYESTAGILTCSGTRPTTPLNGRYYEVFVYVSHPTEGVQTWATFRFNEDPISLRCNGRIRTLETSVISTRVSVTCPFDGQIAVTVGASQPLLWGTAQLNGVDMTCTVGMGGQLNCLTPDAAVGGMYNFHFNATSADGTQTYSWDQSEPIPAVCPHDTSETPNIKVSAHCDTTNPGTYDFTANWSPLGFTFSMVEDELAGVLSCRPLASNAMYCSGATLAADGTLHLKFIHSTPGGPAAFWVYAPPYTLCDSPENPTGWSLEGLVCTGNPSWYNMLIRYPAGPRVTGITLNGTARALTFTAADPSVITLIVQSSDFPATITINRADGTTASHTFNAPSPFPTCGDQNGVQPGFTARASCGSIDGVYDVDIAWAPPDYTIDRVREMGDGWVTCSATISGSMRCYGLTPAGDGLITLGLFHIDATSGDESSYRMSVVPIMCGGGTEGEGASLQDPGCTNDGGIEFYIGTYAGRGYAGVAAADNINTYTCTLTTLGEGGIYRCTGPALTGSPGTLEVNLQHSGSDSYHVSFPEWNRIYPTCGGEQPQPEEWTLSTSCSTNYPGWVAMNITWPESLNPVGTTWMNWSTGCYRTAAMTHSMVCMASLPVSGTLTAYVNSVGSGEQTHSWDAMETRAPTTCSGGDTPDQPGGFNLQLACTNDPNTVTIMMGFPSDWDGLTPTEINDGVARRYSCEISSTSGMWVCTINRATTPGPLEVTMYSWTTGSRVHTFYEYPSLLASTCGSPGSVTPRINITPSCGDSAGYYHFTATWSPPEFTVYRVDDLVAGGIASCGAASGSSITCNNLLMSMLDGRLHVQFVNRPDPMGITEVNYPYDIEVPTGCNGEPDGAPAWGISADCNMTLGGRTYSDGRAHITMTYPDGLGILPTVDNRLMDWVCTMGSAHNTIECIIRNGSWVPIPNPLTWNFPTSTGLVTHTFSEFPGILPTCGGSTGQPFEPDMWVTVNCVRPGQYRVLIDTNFNIDRLNYWGGAPIPPGSCTGLGTHNAVCMVDRLESDGRVWVSATYNLCSGGTCTPHGVTIGVTPSTCPAGSTPTRVWGATISCNDPNFAGENFIFINYPAEYAYHIRTITTPGAAPACNLWFNGDLAHLFYVICYRDYTATPFTINLTLDDGTYISQPFDPTPYIATCGTTPTGGGTQPGGGGTQPGGGTLPPLTCADGTDKSSCSSISGCIWWSRQGTCQTYPEPDCSTYEKESTCNAGACYWWGSACHAYPEPAFDCFATYGTNKVPCLADSRCDWDGAQCFNKP